MCSTQAQFTDCQSLSFIYRTAASKIRQQRAAIWQYHDIRDEVRRPNIRTAGTAARELERKLSVLSQAIQAIEEMPLDRKAV